MNSIVDSRWSHRINQVLVLGALALASNWSMGQTLKVDSMSKPVKPVSSRRVELNTEANQIATGIRAAEVALTLAELAIAQRVEVGQVACELGVSVNIKADSQLPGYFDVQSKKFKYRMSPVVTSTGAIRLEDARTGAVWLQLSNKSMLMNQKLGSRLADVCMNPAQIAVAVAMEKNPPASLLESPQESSPTASALIVPAASPSIAIQ
jgi:hypothetical protein